jgi:Iron/manganese superoxide dismutases, alpha-hairpin domain
MFLIDLQNAVLEKYESALESQNIKAQISLQPAIRFNGGGHINHSVPSGYIEINKSYSGRISPL